MSDTKYSRAEQLFLDALELDAEQRRDFVDRACGDDDTLRQEVLQMLAADESSSDYFENLADRFGIDRLKAGDASQDRESTDRGGQQFGSYRLTELLGRGGMGSVWHGERTDGRFEGAVAVKLLSRAGSHAALERFDREAHYLALLDHPNIARLVDAGIGPEETPYLILDYVDGNAIDTYCDEHRLGIDARLRLCLKAIDAVAHAHAKLIVHNDIKPSNVLVTEDGIVKLLDFGIATLLGDEEGESGRALTPEFASPEQLAGERITTATDVYSLGLLLYVLLTGSSPRRMETLGSLDALRASAQQEPPSLASTLADTRADDSVSVSELAAVRRASPKRLMRVLSGELDDIVQKALAANADERYASAADLASDLRRYLNNEPVSAIPDSFGYRSRKFVSRHRGGVLTAALTALVLIAAVAVTTWQGIEAKRQRDLAVYQQQRLHASNEVYSLLFEEMGSGGQSFTAVELLDRGAGLLQDQFDETDPFIGRVYYDLSRRYSNLREKNREMDLLALAESAARAGNDTDLLAATLCSTASAIQITDAEDAQAKLAEAQELLNGIASPSLEAAVSCARMESKRLEDEGDVDGSLATLQAAIELLESSPIAPTHLQGVTMNDMAHLHFKNGRLAEALVILGDIVELLDENGRGNTVVYATIASNRGSVLGSFGEIAAEAELRRQILERISAAAWADDRGLLMHRLAYASTLIRLSQFEEGIALATSGLETAEALGSDANIAQAHLILARAYGATDRPDETEFHVNAAESALANNPNIWRFQLARAELLRAKIERLRNDPAAANVRIQALLEQEGYPSLERRSSVLRAALSSAAAIALEFEDWAQAEAYINDFIELSEGVARLPDASAPVGNGLMQRARARIGAGRIDEARADLERAIPILAVSLGEDNAETQDAQELLASLDR